MKIDTNSEKRTVLDDYYENASIDKKTISLTELGYQKPRLVTEYVVEYNKKKYAVCPTCGGIIDIPFYPYCNMCGQKLVWQSDSMQPREKR